MAAPPEDCVFCRSRATGITSPEPTASSPSTTISPRAPVHLLVIPERHVDTFRDVGLFSAEESKRMLGFVADAAQRRGLEDYRVLVNVGPGAGQTVFHLHWHVLGDAPSAEDVPSELAARSS